jgi:2-oxoisovalerate dehydrogenase E1 component
VPPVPAAKQTNGAASQAEPPLDGEPITMPFGDLTVSEGKIVRWVKRVGDKVAAGELVVEIETDKAVVEVEAPCAGVLARVLEQEGTTVKMGQQIAVVKKA